jgi:hypothetical protein
MPDWLLTFLPAWEEGVRCVVAGATLTALWRAYCHPKRLPRRVIATASMLITFAIAAVVVWARTRELVEALSNALVIGAMSPIVWAVLVAAAVKWAPWLAHALGEDRCAPRREPWTPEQRRRALFDDTDRIDRSELDRWREEATERKRDE